VASLQQAFEIDRATVRFPLPLSRGPHEAMTAPYSATLADVRALVEKHLPAEYRAKFTWRQLLKR
jgi:hypothetical protein